MNVFITLGKDYLWFCQQLTLVVIPNLQWTRKCFRITVQKRREINQFYIWWMDYTCVSQHVQNKSFHFKCWIFYTIKSDVIAMESQNLLLYGGIEKRLDICPGDLISNVYIRKKLNGNPNLELQRTQWVMSNSLQHKRFLKKSQNLFEKWQKLVKRMPVLSL